MAHQISIANGRAEMAYSGATPWHGLGTPVDGLKSAAEMIDAAGLGWTVGTFPLFCNSVEVPGYKAIMRGDTSAVLGVVSDRYTPIQNTQAADVMDAIVTEGGASVEVCGALGEGERCWMLAQLPDTFEVVKDDVVKPYVLLAWGHDGKHGLAAKLTPIRVVCNNTLTAALGKKWSANADVYVKHTKNATLQLAEAQKALGLVRKQVQQTAAAYQALAAEPLTDDEARGYFARAFPLADRVSGQGRATDRVVSDEARDRWTAQQDTIVDLYHGGKGTQLPGVEGTAWAAYNAVTDWTDHVYPTLQAGGVSAARQTSVLFGRYAEVKANALREALALTSPDFQRLVSPTPSGDFHRLLAQ